VKNLLWRLVEALALQLAPAEREVALGDLIETRTTAWRGIWEMFGLVMRRHLDLWKNWRPWLAAPGLALPCSLMLMGFSFAISMEVGDRFLFGRRLGCSTVGSVNGASIVCQIVVLLICSWAVGFTVEYLSQRTFLESAVCCFLPCLFCLLRFHHQSLPRVCLLLFLLPAMLGVRFGRRGGKISRRWATTLALAGTISIVVLAARADLVVRSVRSGLKPILENRSTHL
jgi:hypothetical protein